MEKTWATENEFLNTRRRKSRLKCLLCSLAILAGCQFLSDAADKDGATVETNSRAAASDSHSEPIGESRFTVQRLRGRVVWMADALQKRHKIQVVPEAKERVLAVETVNGQLYPLVEDTRGRAFRVDSRLRSMDVELLGRRFQGTDAVQIVRIYEIADDRKWIVDYWCDICSIAMFETGPCSCCQADNRLRKRPADD